MNLLHTCSVPQMDFASLSIFVDVNVDMNGDECGGDGEGDGEVEGSFVNLTSVVTPLSTTNPAVAQASLDELHEYLLHESGSYSDANTNTSNSKISMDGTGTTSTTTSSGQIQMAMQNGDDNPYVDAIADVTNENGEKISTYTRVMAQHESLVNGLVGDNDHYPSRSKFCDQCLKEDELYFGTGARSGYGYGYGYGNGANAKAKPQSSDTNGAKNNSSSHGVFRSRSRGRISMEYVIIRDRDVIEKCTSPFFGGKQTNGNGKSNINSMSSSVKALVIAVGITGAPYSYHSHPLLHSLRSRLEEFQEILHTFQICVTKSSAESQRHDLELMLTSLLMDDESLKTNTQIEIESGNLHVYADAHSHSEMTFHANGNGHGHGHSHSKFFLSNIHHSSGKSKRFKKKLFSERKRRRKKGERKKDVNGNDASLKDNMTSTAIISSSAPSSEVAKILSDQMQVLSLAEKGMMMRGYEKAKAKRQSDRERWSGGGTGARSPPRSRRGIGTAGKDRVGAGGGDLAGFDYVPTATSNVTMWNPVMSANSADMNWLQRTTSTDYTADSTATATTSTESTTSSATYIPTLSGPIRDSSATKKQIRRNKVLKASIANQYSRAWKSSAPQENGGKGAGTGMQSPPRYRDNHNNTRSKFNPFVSVKSGDNGHGRHSQIKAPNSLGREDPVLNDGFTSSPIRSTTSESSTNFFSNGSGRSIEREEAHTGTPKDPSPTSNIMNIPDFSNPTSYIPGSRKLFTIMALNEDLSCTYHGSTIVSCQVEGIVQLQLKSESTAFVPFTIQVWDGDDHIKTIHENSQYAKNISHEASSALDLNNGWKHKYVVTMPKADNYYPVLKYKCSEKVVPVPLRVQSKVRTNGKSCRVALQISSNPSNEKKLTELTITMSVPDSVIGETLKTMPEGGVWNAEKRHVLWCVKELGRGEKFQLQGQFAMYKTDIFGVNEELSFPISVRCQSMSAQLSNVKLECLDSKRFPADVSMKFARRFRVAQKEYLDKDPKSK